MNDTEIKGVASGIPIYCSFTVIEPIGKLVPNPRNPYKHPPAQVELLAKIIEGQGWRRPIRVSTRSGFVVAGHAALEAANKLGATEVPVDYQFYATEAAEYADLIADNRLAELAETNYPELKDLLQDLDTGEIDTDLTGFSSEELERLMSQYHAGVDEKPTPLDDPAVTGPDDRNKFLILVYATDEEREEWFSRLGYPEAPRDKRMITLDEIRVYKA